MALFAKARFVALLSKGVVMFLVYSKYGTKNGYTLLKVIEPGQSRCMSKTLC